MRNQVNYTDRESHQQSPKHRPTTPVVRPLRSDKTALSTAVGAECAKRAAGHGHRGATPQPHRSTTHTRTPRLPHRPRPLRLPRTGHLPHPTTRRRRITTRRPRPPRPRRCVTNRQHQRRTNRPQRQRVTPNIQRPAHRPSLARHDHRHRRDHRPQPRHPTPLTAHPHRCGYRNNKRSSSVSIGVLSIETAASMSRRVNP